MIKWKAIVVIFMLILMHYSSLLIRASSLCIGEQADYIIITPSAWITSFDQYIIAKNSQSIKTRLFTVEDILANFLYIINGPAAKC